MIRHRSPGLRLENRTVTQKEEEVPEGDNIRTLNFEADHSRWLSDKREPLIVQVSSRFRVREKRL
jgi:hypothetical protein